MDKDKSDFNNKKKAEFESKLNAYIKESKFTDYSNKRVELQFSPRQKQESHQTLKKANVSDQAFLPFKDEQLQQLMAQFESERAALIKENQQLKVNQIELTERNTAYMILSQKAVKMQDELTHLREENQLLKEERATYRHFEKIQREMVQQIQIVHQKMMDKDRKIQSLQQNLLDAQQQISQLSAEQADYQQFQQQIDSLKKIVGESEGNILQGYDLISHQVKKFTDKLPYLSSEIE